MDFPLISAHFYTMRVVTEDETRLWDLSIYCFLPLEIFSSLPLHDPFSLGDFNLVYLS